MYVCGYDLDNQKSQARTCKHKLKVKVQVTFASLGEDRILERRLSEATVR